MSATSSVYTFTSTDNSKYVLRFFTHSKNHKKYIDILQSYYDENGNLQDLAWTFEFTKEDVQRVLGPGNTYISEDARKYYMRLVRNSAFI
jgi:hypothetical protein